MAVPTITIGGTDRTTSIDLYSIRLSGSGTADSETLTFDISDPTNAITVADGATVNLTESGGALTFGGFVQVVTPVHTALGRVLRVSAISKGILLDRLLVPSLERSAGESDYTRITYLLATYGTGLSTTYTSIATLNASMPAQTFAAMTLRSALESVAALASSTGKFYVDATGKLHYYSSVPTAAPYAIKVGTPGAGEVAPEDLEVERDSTGIVNAYYVQGANDLGSGWVTNATSIATYGRRESYLTAPDADTSGKRDSYGAAALAQTKDPIARGTFTVSSPYDGWAQEQTVTITSPQDGLSGSTFVIQKVNRSYKAPSGDRTYTVEFGGALPRFSSANPPPASIPGRLITPGSLSITPFASNVRPVAIVSSLPTLPDPVYPIGAFVYNTGDAPDTLYKTSDGTNWIKAVGPGDIQADSITAGQIAAGAISTTELAASAVTAEKIAAGAILISSIPSSADRVNLLRNGSFEDFTGTAGTYANPTPFTGWTTTQSQVLTTASTSANAKSGDYVCAMKLASGGAAYASLSQSVSVRAGKKYRLSGWLWKVASGGTAIAIVAHTYDKAWTVVAYNVISIGATTSTTPTFYEGTYTVPAGVAYMNVRLQMGTPAPADTEIFGIEDVFLEEVPTDVTNSDGNVVITSTGITVTNGKITVNNAGGTTVIDGTSDIFRIVATGTASIPSYSGSTTASVTVSLTGLGTRTTPIAYQAYATATGTVQKQLALSIDLSSPTAYVATSSGGSPTTQTHRIQVYYESESKIVTSTATLVFRVLPSNSSGSAMTVRYYALDQVSL